MSYISFSDKPTRAVFKPSIVPFYSLVNKISQFLNILGTVVSSVVIISLQGF